MSRPASKLYAPGLTDASITRAITAPPIDGLGPRWLVLLAIGTTGALVLAWALVETLRVGVGLWGIQVPVGWGLAIVNFVWWIGIGHAGTLISAILLLMHQQWRTSINRFAESMTLFAVACAGLFPLLHMGRPEYFYWLLPYPSTTQMWPQFRSPLVWDAFAISTYGTVSLLFWYLGLVPDLAVLRDRARRRLTRVVYGIFALGWRGSSRHWHRHQQLYRLFAGLATPLVVSVHTVVSFDFAIGLIPGWHSTIFPPFFVAGAIYSGFAMVITIAIPLRWGLGLHDYVRPRHFDLIAKVLLASGWVVAYGYATEIFVGWYSGGHYELWIVERKLVGDLAGVFWATVACNVVLPQALWSKRVRASLPALFALSIVINIGMWLERYLIVVGSLEGDFVPSSWRSYWPTIYDWAIYLGTMGLFILLFALLVRFVPVVSMAEMRELIREPVDSADRIEDES